MYKSDRLLNKVNFIFIGAMAFLIISCSETSQLQKADWLQGTWENKTKKGSVYETWIKESNQKFSANSFKLKEGDTLILERIDLIQEEDNVFFIPLVSDQNEGLPVRFTIKKMSDTQMVFENLSHDFPQIITYTQVSNDSLLASISGKQNGEEVERFFPMKRIK